MSVRRSIVGICFIFRSFSNILRVPSLSHSRSAIEIANQLFDLRKLISSEFVMSYSLRRAGEAGRRCERTEGEWTNRPTGRPRARAFVRADEENENCCRSVGRWTDRPSVPVVHPGGRFREERRLFGSRQAGRLSDCAVLFELVVLQFDEP